MLSRRVRNRIAKLAPHEAMAVRIELPLCRTAEEYEVAFALAWDQVPIGATVFCWLRDLSDREYHDMVLGVLIPPTQQGLFFKTTGERVNSTSLRR